MRFFKRNNYRDLDDAALLALYYTKREEACLETLLGRYSSLVVGVCLKYVKSVSDAEECAMEVFAKCWQELEKDNIQNLKAWLFATSRNTSLSWLTQKGKLQNNLAEIKREMDMQTENTFVKADDKFLKLLPLAIEELKDAQKLCVTLFYLNGSSYQEISDQTGLSLNEVKSHIQNGKRNLKLILEKHHG